MFIPFAATGEDELNSASPFEEPSWRRGEADIVGEERGMGEVDGFEKGK